ncbi:MAG: hypothetical protein IJV56_02130 [Neisseriaceae bacterium]|nr:hypothetical protein [Neisseriaceae bacterium]
MEQPKIHTTAATGGHIRKIMSWALFALCFSTPVAAEPTLQELIEQGNKQARSINFTGKMDNSSQEVMLPIDEIPDNPDKEDADRATTIVFISHSIPENELMRLLEQGSGRDDVLFVLRGFVDGELANSENMLAKIAEKSVKLNKEPPNVMVYPQAFNEYEVIKVPAVLHQNKDGNWYMAQGGLDINYAISAIEKHQYKMPLSRQWVVAEPDQIEVQYKKVQNEIAQNSKKWEEERLAAMDKQFNGEIILPYATQNKKELFTPYYTLPENIIHPETRKIMYAKGTKINVLGEDKTGKRILVFVDGRDKWQVEYANTIHQQAPHAYIFYTQRGKLEHGIPLDGLITERFQVTEVPTVLIQKGNRFERRTYKRR